MCCQQAAQLPFPQTVMLSLWPLQCGSLMHEGLSGVANASLLLCRPACLFTTGCQSCAASRLLNCLSPNQSC